MERLEIAWWGLGLVGSTKERLKMEGSVGRMDGSVWLVNYSESREKKRYTHPLICKARKEGTSCRAKRGEPSKERSNPERNKEPNRREGPKELSGGEGGRTRRAAER